MTTCGIAFISFIHFRTAHSVALPQQQNSPRARLDSSIVSVVVVVVMNSVGAVVLMVAWPHPSVELLAPRATHDQLTPARQASGHIGHR